ncbi:MAG: 4Fe-4S dicluster domain-containing protein, partial [Myxococcota bacterium]
VERFFQRWTHGSSISLRKPVAQVAKYTLFLVFSMGLAHTFLAYFVSTYALRGWITQSPFEHPGPFLVMSGTVGLMMFDFSYFREQMCTVICPYARLQSALLDRDSIVVGFDARRGEPRGKGAARELVRLGTTGLSSRRPGTSPHAISSAAPEHSASERSFGDCIDCGACVRTCPTGIDIRDGLQLECIACAQCVDACDAIMDQLGAPRGLVRYSSQRNLEHGTRPRWLRARTLAYPIILLGLIAGLAWVVSGTRGAQIELLRNPGAPFEALSNGSVRSSVRLRVANRNTQDERYAISVDESDVAVVAPLNPLTVAPNETESTTLFVTVPLSSFDANGERQIIIRVETSGGQTYEESFKLLGPMRSAR